MLVTYFKLAKQKKNETYKQTKKTIIIFFVINIKIMVILKVVRPLFYDHI